MAGAMISTSWPSVSFSSLSSLPSHQWDQAGPWAVAAADRTHQAGPTQRNIRLPTVLTDACGDTVSACKSLDAFELEILASLVDFDFEPGFSSETRGFSKQELLHCSQPVVTLYAGEEPGVRQDTEGLVIFPSDGEYFWAQDDSSTLQNLLPDGADFDETTDLISDNVSFVDLVPPPPAEKLPEEKPVLSRTSRNRTPRAVKPSPRDPFAPKRCQIPNCLALLEESYNIRYKLCKTCVRAPVVHKDGRDARFCQQCGYLHEISEFDGAKRSCRKKLERHASRVRKWRSSKISRGRLITMTEEPQLLR
eukprot:scaffold27930_cov46-Prasinocladus_malaysianus.AAC.3